MPSASDELRAEWGGHMGIGEDKATDHLQSRGWTLSKDWHWSPPPNKEPAEDDWRALDFLIQEWDFGYRAVPLAQIEPVPEAPQQRDDQF